MTTRRRPPIRWGPGPALAVVIVACGAVAAGLYVSTIRSAVDVGDTGRANARALAEWEARLGLGWTHDLTDTWLTAGPLEIFWVAVYSLGYWPFLALAAGWALVFDRVRLQSFIVLVGVTGLVGVVVMTLVPLSPPRLVGTSDPIRDTALQRIAHPDRLMNEHAAMPSFHVAWSIAAAATLATARGPLSRLRRLTWWQPMLMTLATLTTGNHWLSDAVAGCALIVVAWYPVRMLVTAARRQFAAARPSDDSAIVSAETLNGHVFSPRSPVASRPRTTPQRGSARVATSPTATVSARRADTSPQQIE